MKIGKNKTAAIAFAIFMMVSMSASMLLVPSAGAHTPAWTLPTFAYINASPNPVGVGQGVEVIMWLNYVIDGAAANNAVRFQNYQLTITDPKGVVTTKTFPIISDTTSAQDYFLVPDTVGVYTLKFDFPGQIYTYATTSAYKNDTYAASSASTTLTVQQQAISNLALNPLPTNYWTRPIYGTNPNWYVISSNWLGTGSVGYGGFAGTFNMGGNGEVMNGNNGDSIGSLTSHIMWTKPLQAGGIVGGNQSTIQGASYFEGSAYSARFVNPIIMEGLLYYTAPLGYNGPSSGPTVCVNLQTGAVVWSRTDVPALSFGYIFDQQNANQHGTWPPILFTSAYRAFDAYTGNSIFNLTNVPSGTKLMGPSGELLIVKRVNYGVAAAPNYYLQEWNISKLWFNANTIATLFTPSNAPSITDGSNALLLDWNVSAPYLNTVVGTVTQVAGITNDVLLCYNGSLPSTGATSFIGSVGSAPYTYFTLNINGASSSLGQNIWHQTLNPPANNITVLEDGIDPVNRVFVENLRETNNFVGYSLDTGAKLWGPTTPQPSLDYYGSPASATLAAGFSYGKLYSAAYAGIVYCYDTSNGNLLWTYGNGGSGNTTDSGLETPFGHYPTFINAIGGGIVYTVTTEHTIETPLFKGSLARAINATTGQEIWSVSGYTGEFTTFSYAMADGYNTWFNGYDNSIYVVGRGPSATTVQAPLTSVTVGDKIVIQGTVMDKATGTTQTQQAGNFPNGVPASSDASMREWMGYVYQQQPSPSNFTGVTVSLGVLDSNNNFRSIGTATTDASGTYNLNWAPDIPGSFTIYAEFGGTNGYYPSFAETHVYSNAPATPTATATPIAGFATPNDVMYIGIAIIVVIIIIGAVLAVLMMRKR
jgi:outer membrane protein assembly factor BamB